MSPSDFRDQQEGESSRGRIINGLSVSGKSKSIAQMGVTPSTWKDESFGSADETSVSMMSEIELPSNDGWVAREQLLRPGWVSPKDYAQSDGREGDDSESLLEHHIDCEPRSEDRDIHAGTAQRVDVKSRIGSFKDRVSGFLSLDGPSTRSATSATWIVPFDKTNESAVLEIAIGKKLHWWSHEQLFSLQGKKRLREILNKNDLIAGDGYDSHICDLTVRLNQPFSMDEVVGDATRCFEFWHCPGIKSQDQIGVDLAYEHTMDDDNVGAEVDRVRGRLYALRKASAPPTRLRSVVVPAFGMF